MAGFTHAVSSRTRTELEHAARENEAITHRESRDEPFLDMAQRLAVGEAHGDARFGHDRPDADPVPARDPCVGNARDAVVIDDDATVFGIGVETRATVDDEVHRELPFVVGEVAVRVRTPDFGAEQLRSEPAAQRAGDEMLHQDIERLRERQARLDRACTRGFARGRGLDQFERLRRDDGDARRRAGLVAAAARALQEARHAFRAADLQHLVDGREIDAEIETRRADHGAQFRAPQAIFDPVAHLALERTVMQRDPSRPIGPCVENRLVPDLGLRADVGEDQRRLGAVDRADHFGKKPEADVSRPREALDGAWPQAVDDGCLGVFAPDDRGAIPTARADERRERVVEIREGGRQTPHAQPGARAREARERQLRLYAAFGRQQFVPFVDDDCIETGEALAPVGPRQEERQALRRGDKRRRQPLALARAGAGRGVAGAHVDGPVGLQRRGRSGDGETRVGGQGAERRDPQQRQRRRFVRRARGAQRQRRQRRSVGLAHARRRVHEP